MNRLILVGNGFDLAHKLPTSYNDFMLWILKNSYQEAATKGSFDSKLIKIHSLYSFENIFGGVFTVENLIDQLYKDGFEEFFVSEKLHVPTIGEVMNPFKTEMDPFLRILLRGCRYMNWVVIENEFYRALKEILKDGAKDMAGKKLSCVALNTSMRHLIEAFGGYLKKLRPPGPGSAAFGRIYEAPFQEREFKTEKDFNELKSLVPEHIHVLNFNYTNTASWYSTNIDQRVNNIHGSIHDVDNPIVFGFGDELDDYYAEIEKSGINEFFEYIKSFWYLRSQNYYNLLRFVESGHYQIYILGHSCGLSDRTMLSMLFKHNNCRSIKIFYYEKEKGQNNFTELSMEISRHFSNKEMLREKLVNLEFCEKMPQLRW